MIRLSDHIAAAGGWLSLEAFMQLALYHPQEGYYSSSIENIGQRGDFSTTPTLSPILAKAIIAHWKEACSRCGRRLPLLEIGAGSGALAVKILERLGFWNRLNTDYVIVESSPRLREFQHLLLGGRAKIYSTMEKALKHCGGKAFIFSNELVDAFPARVFEYTEQDWKEVGLVVKNGAVREELRPVRQQPLFSHMLEYGSQPGQRVEIHDSYARWFTSWLPHWNMGVMTVIDYGDEMERLYYRRPRGSLRGYKSHQVLTGEELYRNPGLTDLTCDVNFTDLLELSRNCLEDRVTFMTQRDYLLPHAENTPQDAFLTDEYGAGGHFHVLIQERQRLQPEGTQ